MNYKQKVTRKVTSLVFLYSCLSSAVRRLVGVDVEEVPGHKPRTGAPGQLAGGEDGGEYVSEGVTAVEECFEQVEGISGGREGVSVGGAGLVQVVLPPPVTVTEHLVGLCEFFEFLLRVWGIIFVRVELKSLLLVRLLYLLQRGRSLHTKAGVVVFTRHGVTELPVTWTCDCVTCH